jgi:hypothetical protein
MPVASHESYTTFAHNAHKLVAGFVSDLSQRYQEASSVLTGDSQILWKRLESHAQSNLEVLKSTLPRLSVYSSDDFKSLEGAIKRTRESLEAYQNTNDLDYIGWLARAPQVLAERLEARELLRSSGSTHFASTTVVTSVVFKELKIQILASSGSCYLEQFASPPDKPKQSAQPAPASKLGFFSMLSP